MGFGVEDRAETDVGSEEREVSNNFEAMNLIFKTFQLSLIDIRRMI